MVVTVSSLPVRHTLVIIIKNECRRTIMDGTKRANIKHGMSVAIVLKQDQDTGRLTDGIVRDLLTKSSSHPHGIKVRLMSGEVGRVKEIY